MYNYWIHYNGYWQQINLEDIQSFYNHHEGENFVIEERYFDNTSHFAWNIDGYLPDFFINR